MPLPWKKAKCARISQLVANHLQSPKRGGTLVVETGFPTSLVDLFVKNRDRLKKSNKKKPSTDLDQTQTYPLPPASPPRPAVSLRAPSPLRAPSQVAPLIPPSSSNISPSLPEIDGVVVEEEGCDGAAANGVFAVVLKMFLVVILVLGTKRLVVGITMSAFLLFFLEFVGKHLCRLFQPCSNSHNTLRSVAKRVSLILRIKQDKEKLTIEKENRSSAVSDSPRFIYDCDLNAHTSEVEIMQPKFNLVPPVEEIGSVQVKSDASGCDKKWECEEMDLKKGVLVPPFEEIQGADVKFDASNSDEKWVCEEMDATKGVVEKEDDNPRVSGLENRRSQRAKIKSKMKKLVPKKLRGSRKKFPKGEACSAVGEDKAAMCGEQEENKNGKQCEWDYEGKSSLFEDADANCSYGELSQGYVEAVVGVEVCRETKGNSGYLGLSLIVLVGLVGGRVLALVLTLLWCLMLKSGRTIRGYKKVPMVRSSG